MLREYPIYQELGSASEPRVSTRCASKAGFPLALGFGGHDQKMLVRTGGLGHVRSLGGRVAFWHPRRGVWTVVAHGSGSCG